MWYSPATPERKAPVSSAPPRASSVEQSPQSSFRRRPVTPRSTLDEALKGDPFRTVRTSDSIEPHARNLENDDPVTLLNKDLKVIANVYPDVKIEVLRELLSRFDGDSRLYICIEQLVKYKGEWTRGRILNPPREPDCDISVEELFRSKTYIAASKQTLYTEFKGLNRSVVEAVLAEVNHSYSKARPVLQGIAAKSWRVTFSSFFKRKRALDEPPSFLVQKYDSAYALQSTDNDELDDELEQMFFAAPRQQRQKLQEQKDSELAIVLNQREAEDLNALFECQVCYNDVTFESIVTCTLHAHTICRECVRRTLNEAVFGQGWAQSVDVEHGTLRCVASDDQGQCTGHVASNLLQNTIAWSDSGAGTWNKFEQRLAIDNLTKSGLSLTQCPFCHYAENPQIYTESTAQHIAWQFRNQQLSFTIVLYIVIAELVFPTLLFIILVLSLVSPGLPRQIFHSSLITSYNLAQTKRFRCKNPTCLRTSCLSCSKLWHDPHQCHEPLILSLRTAVEAARTAALKRTCPRCGTSFVKSSGCNKLTCVCGYAMCYLCRRNIGKVNENGAVDDHEGGEGYRHFCEHFRPTLGQKCTECSKCDLYMNEDEEVTVRQAGEQAEREWREREGMIGVRGLGLEEAVGSLVKLGRDDGPTLSEIWHSFVTGDWTVQGLSDWAVNKSIIIES